MLIEWKFVFDALFKNRGMDTHYVALLFPLMVGLAWANTADPCFTFNGNGFLRFDILNFDNSHHAHYSMKFKTTSPHGLLLYSDSPDGDDEALYIRAGRLVYHLFNSSPTGVEGFFGGRFLGNMPVNTGDEVEVHVYRHFNVTDAVQRRTRKQTGLVYTVGGRTYTHVDFRTRTGIDLNNGVYIGGYKESLSDTVGNFTGQISGIREEKNGALFSTFSRNLGGRVSTSCLATFQPN